MLSAIQSSSCVEDLAEHTLEKAECVSLGGAESNLRKQSFCDGNVLFSLLFLGYLYIC